MKKTLVIGASTNEERYSNKAIKSLVGHNHHVFALGLKSGVVEGVSIDTEMIDYDGIDTVTMYVGAKNQTSYFDYIEQLAPKRVIFNPGTENPVFEERLQRIGIEVEVACTLVLLATGQY